MGVMIYLTKQPASYDGSSGQAGALEGLVRSSLDEAYFRWADADALSPLTREHMAKQMARVLSESGFR